MDRKEIEEWIAANYRRDEQMMVDAFAQWCINHDLDPEELYTRAYPQQAANPALQGAISQALPKENSPEIPDDALLQLLSMFDNEELGYVVSNEIAQRKENRG
ncbi:hypothetical protein [Paenibacillus nasutitermitis]|uniref:Uncharacterized protein n=1 Tax=Paenibacillus nasutitermitis TaxID=1652958 RepID=A0A917DLR0_9BACL|nr:hypothetical protein [Paenibacillus nasutitermitis]GGD50537.1 hypothetical protein GCM10010911_05070 [Paenibacillus nasutitermitis]